MISVEYQFSGNIESSVYVFITEIFDEHFDVIFDNPFLTL